MKRRLRKLLYLLLMIILCYAGVLYLVAWLGKDLVIVVLCIALGLSLVLLWWLNPQ